MSNKSYIKGIVNILGKASNASPPLITQRFTYILRFYYKLNKQINKVLISEL